MDSTDVIGPSQRSINTPSEPSTTYAGRSWEWIKGRFNDTKHWVQNTYHDSIAHALSKHCQAGHWIDCITFVGMESLLGFSAVLASIGTFRVTHASWDAHVDNPKENHEGKEAIGHVGEWPSQVFINLYAMGLFKDLFRKHAGQTESMFGLQTRKAIKGIKIAWNRGNIIDKAQIVGYVAVGPAGILITSGLQAVGAWYSITGEVGKTPQIGHGGEWLGQAMLAVILLKKGFDRFVDIAKKAENDPDITLETRPHLSP